jgi:fructose-1,6-bisphosphatase/inositol monophosphatase family enzyme
MNRFSQLCRTVKMCGAYAAEAQYGISRNRKPDGSILTEADLAVDRELTAEICRLYPRSAVISEESGASPVSSGGDEGEYTVIIDPIDGTDSYSQGFPGWCIAVGFLDSDRTPAGAVICAPRWGIGSSDGLFIALDPETGTCTVEGAPEMITEGPAGNPRRQQVSQIVIGSQVHTRLNLKKFPGKCRTFGSTIIHLLAPALLTHIGGAIVTGGYIWDIAASHALLAYAGMELSDCRGNPLRYTDSLLSGRQENRTLFSGSPASCASLRTLLCDF